MDYMLSDGCGDSICVPQLVFANLKKCEDDFARVALFVVATKIFDCAIIARELRLKSPSHAREALLFWKGVGLICDCDEAVAAQNATQIVLEQPRLTTRQVVQASLNDNNIQYLLEECQKIFGAVITENDSNELVSLYLVCEMPIDMILMGVTHFCAAKKRSGKYISRALQGWQAQGIDSGQACEKHLLQLEKRHENEREIAKLFKLENAKFTKLEGAMIAEWFEGFGFDLSMISEAADYAGEKNTVKYINGILRSWYSKGYKNAKDVQINAAMQMNNLQPKNTVASRDILQEAYLKIPVYKKLGD